MKSFFALPWRAGKPQHVKPENQNLKRDSSLTSTVHTVPVDFDGLGDFNARLWVARDLYGQYVRNCGNVGVCVSRESILMRYGQYFELQETRKWDAKTGSSLYSLLCELLPEVNLDPHQIERQLILIQEEQDKPVLTAHGYQVLGKENGVGVYRVRDQLGRVLIAKKLRWIGEWGKTPWIKHENIVRIFSHVPGFLVMELVEGDPWNDEQLLQLPKNLRIEACRQLFRGLAELHANSTIHGDIKPANVIVRVQTQNEQPVGVDVVLIDITGHSVLNCIRAPEESEEAPANEAPLERFHRQAATDVFKAATMCDAIYGLPIFKDCGAVPLDEESEIRPEDRPMADSVVTAINKAARPSNITYRSLVALFFLASSLWVSHLPATHYVYHQTIGSEFIEAHDIHGFKLSTDQLDTGSEVVGVNDYIEIKQADGLTVNYVQGVIVRVDCVDDFPIVVVYDGVQEIPVDLPATKYYGDTYYPTDEYNYPGKPSVFKTPHETVFYPVRISEQHLFGLIEEQTGCRIISVARDKFHDSFEGLADLGLRRYGKVIGEDLCLSR